MLKYTVYISIILVILICVILVLLNKSTMQNIIEPLKIEIRKGMGYSQWNQDSILIDIFNKIGTTNKYFIEFGARNPDVLNSTYFRKNGWSGLLMDGAPDTMCTENEKNCSTIIKELLNNFDNDKVKLRKEFITRENINQLFYKY